jgi:hypothetical protein
MWAVADSLAEVLPLYKKVWQQKVIVPSEDDTYLVNLYKGSKNVVTSGIEAVQLAKAQGLWVATDTLYKNRGPEKAGNQLDLPRGSRVFFGFRAAEVPKNTIFGELTVQCEGFKPAVRTMRFGNNMMDKVNLPVPGPEVGPKTYDHSVLLFQRHGRDTSGRPLFVVKIGGDADLAKWKKTAAGFLEGKMQSGRRYGLLF